MLCKKRLPVLYAAVLVLSTVWINGCNLKLFSAVQIKASPELYMPIASNEYTADSYLSSKKLEEFLHREDGLDSSKKMRVYAYDPAVPASPGQKDQMRFLLHYPLSVIDLGMSGYLNDVPADLGQTAKAAFPEKTFTMPTVNAAEEIDMAPSLNAAFLVKWNAVSARSLPVSGAVSIPMTDLGVQSVTFGSGGKLTFTLSGGAACTGAKLKIDGSADDLSGTVAGNTVTFSIENRTIDRLELTLQGVTGSGSIQHAFSGTIKRAEGVTADFPQFPINKAIPVSSDNTFKQAVIEKGSAGITIPEQTGWTVTKTTSIRQAVPSGSLAGLSIAPLADSTSSEGNLAGKNINGQDIEVTSAITVKLDNATYDSGTVKTMLWLTIDSFSDVVLSAESLPLKRAVSIPIVAAVSDHVKSITFAKPAITVAIKNGFPVGNTIEAEVHSDQLGITHQKRSFEASGSEEERLFEGANDKTIPLDGVDKLETTVTLKLPNYNEGNKTFTLKNVKPGAIFTFSGSAAFKGNWDSILLKVEKDISGSFPHDSATDIGIAPFTKVLKELQLKVHDIPLYVYIGSDAFPNKKIQADFKLTVNTRSGGTAGSPEVLFEQHAKDLTFAILPSGLLPVQSDTFTGKLPSASIAVKKGAEDVTKSLADVINDYPDSLRLEYTGRITDIEINYEEFEKLKKQPELGKLKQDIIWDAPIGFHAENNGDVPLGKLTGTELPNDLFGRAESSSQDVRELIDAFLRSASLQLKLTNTTGLTSSAVLRFLDSNGIKIVEDKELIISSGTVVKTITFTKDECKKLAGVYPVTPRIFVKLAEGDYYVKRNSRIQGELAVVVAADIDYKIQVGH